MPVSSRNRQDSMQLIIPQGFRTEQFPLPYWSAPGAMLYLGDVRACLRRLPERSVHCVVTSPPYYQLRDYGTATWEGGSSQCDHLEKVGAGTRGGLYVLNYNRGQAKKPEARSDTNLFTIQYKETCLKCGARRIDKQIGMEPTTDCLSWATGLRCNNCFVCSMVDVFHEVWRVLRDDGVLFLNLGDTFDNGQTMVPARTALALRADGWKLVQDIIWYSPNKMPESVTNRCTKSHEHIFLLAKGDGCYFDSVAIMDDAVKGSDSAGKRNYRTYADNGRVSEGQTEQTKEQGKNKRDVWIVPTTGYPGAHFATFSPKLITPCILAGTSEAGCCANCGRPLERVVRKTGADIKSTRGQP